MRFRMLFFADIRTQYKYGFYLLYLFLTVLYLALLYALPDSWRQKAAQLLIFTDPAALGLYFMGAIVLFEKSERVLDSLAVSPVKTHEYVLSKLFSLAVISTAAAVVIGVAGGVVSRPVPFAAGVFLCSCLFSSLGLICACKVSTLNQFVLLTVPAEILVCLPAILRLFFLDSAWLAVHPGSALVVILTGGAALVPLLFLLLWTVLFALLACGTVERMLKSLGGMTL